MNDAPHRPFSIRMPLYWLGLILFFVNIETDERFGIPATEFVLLGLILLQFVIYRSVIHLKLLHIASLLSLFLLLWVTAVEFYHAQSVSGALRVMVRTFLFYAIIIGYLYLPDKRPTFLLIVGLVSGYALHFLYESIVTFVTASPSTFFELKYIIPTPGILGFLVLSFRRQLPRSVLYLLVGCLVYTVPAMFLIGSRGAFISLIIGLGAYVVGHLFRPPKALIIAVALYIPLIPTTVALVAGDPNHPMKLAEKLFAIDYATHSNVERTLMVSINVKTMQEHFMLGIGRDALVPMVEPYFVHLSGLQAMTGSSPHNYYLEFSVPFGVPAMLIIILILMIIYRLMFVSSKVQGQSTGIACFAMMLTSWIMLYQPVAGITRIDIFILMIASLYGIQNSLLQTTSGKRKQRSIAANPEEK